MNNMILHKGQAKRLLQLLPFYLFSFLLLGALASCGDDDPDGEEIFPTAQVNRDDFDKWLVKNFSEPYNVEVKYKMEDRYSDMTHNLIPADSAKSAKLMKLVKYLWFDAYDEVAGTQFVKENTPRIIHLIGSPAYNTGQGTIVMGTAEGGYMVTLYMVNWLTDDVIGNISTLNDYYLHTMHHEFTHILTQKKSYSENYQLITEGAYVSNDWIYETDHEAHQAGFVTPYAMSEYNEDIAEMMATYITDTPDQWRAIIADAGTTGASLINQKLEILRSYMKESWGLDIDELRDCIQRRVAERYSIDLEHLD